MYFGSNITDFGQLSMSLSHLYHKLEKANEKLNTKSLLVIFNKICLYIYIYIYYIYIYWKPDVIVCVYVCVCVCVCVCVYSHGVNQNSSRLNL